MVIGISANIGLRSSTGRDCRRRRPCLIFKSLYILVRRQRAFVSHGFGNKAVDKRKLRNGCNDISMGFWPTVTQLAFGFPCLFVRPNPLNLRRRIKKKGSSRNARLSSPFLCIPIVSYPFDAVDRVAKGSYYWIVSSMKGFVDRPLNVFLLPRPAE